MKFCQQCDNMYYITINSENQNELQYFCRNCKFVDNSITAEGGCILDVQNTNQNQHFNKIINKYTKYDPTLPHIFNMKCPNIECESNTTQPYKHPDVVYIRYDDANLKYVYICSKCDTNWKTNDKLN